jgi:hypothetical protein
MGYLNDQVAVCVARYRVLLQITEGQDEVFNLRLSFIVDNFIRALPGHAAQCLVMSAPARNLPKKGYNVSTIEYQMPSSSF